MTELHLPSSYVWRARTFPAVLVATPPLCLLAGGLASATHSGRIGAAVSAALVLAPQFVRDAGRRLQPGLWKEWGGPPTTARLRHRAKTSAQVTARVHTRVEAATGEKLPSAEEERLDPDAADARYDDAVAVLRTRTRDPQRFGLLFSENVHYGFRRNCLGLRWWGIAVAIITIAVCLILILNGHGSFSHRTTPYLVAVIVAVAALAFWSRVVTRGWVRSAAEIYAQTLIDSAALVSQAPEACGGNAREG